MATHNDPQHAVNGQMSANTWALTLILHRTQRVADEAINRALDCSLTSHRGAPWSTPHVTCVTRHAQNAKPTSRCRTVAPWSSTMRRVFHPETNGVKASPHRHKWMLSRGALASHGISTRRTFHPAKTAGASRRDLPRMRPQSMNEVQRQRYLAASRYAARTDKR